MRWTRPLVLTCSLLAAGTAYAQDGLIDLSAHAARANRAARRDRLAPPGASRIETLRAFLESRHDSGTLRDLVQVKEHESAGTIHAMFGQQVAGLDVYGTYVKASFRSNGDLTSVVENLVSAARALRPARVGPEAALRVVLARYYPGIAADPPEISSVGNVVTFERVGPLDHSPTVTRIALPLRGSALDSGYLVVTWDRANMLRHTVVSGRGEILYEQLRTNQESFRIFPNHPGITPQQLMIDPADPVASPVGWLGLSTTTTGNNVDAYLDRDNNDIPDAGGRPVAANRVFDFAWDGATDPATPTNQMAAVTNLFYLNNVLHDTLYGYGFTESAGNFQTNNFGRGGLENDPLNAEAQDGGGFSNANFATPDDGSRPRMQMYLWNANSVNPLRDGDLDSDIVYHEYGHGLTWRMIGDMGNVTGAAVGEGMSDALATYLNGDDRIAEYSYNNPIGIRSAPYTNYTRTYGLVVGFVGPHLDGEIYAATMWRLRQLWLAKGWSQHTLLRYIVDGMNYTAPQPAYEDMRDGILASIANLTTEVSDEQAACTVWDAFAQFGVGVGADGSELCVIGICLFRATESFVKPPTCTNPLPNTAPTVLITSPTTGISITVGTPVAFSGSASDTQDGNLSSSLVWVSNLQGPIGTGASFSRADLAVGTHVITATATDSGNLPGSATVTIVVSPPNTPPSVTITAPVSGSTMKLGTSVTFTGSASDQQDGNVSASLVWVSSKQGSIGTGGSFQRSNLQVGTHIVTATAIDSAQLTGSAQVTVTVVNITLTARAYKLKGVRKVDLTWGGATPPVDVYRNNLRITTTTNNGFYTDTIAGKGGGSFGYKVCNSGSTTVCSNTVTVTF